MNTQERVLAMLNKVQKVREVKKENLGAIEDAIKEAQDNISVQVVNFEQLLSSINNSTETIVDGMMGYAMQARDTVNNVQSYYDEYEAEYLRLSQELDALGLPYEGLDVSVKSDFKDAINYLDLLANTEF